MSRIPGYAFNPVRTPFRDQCLGGMAKGRIAALIIGYVIAWVRLAVLGLAGGTAAAQQTTAAWLPGRSRVSG